MSIQNLEIMIKQGRPCKPAINIIGTLKLINLIKTVLTTLTPAPEIHDKGALTLFIDKSKNIYE